ncbi:hypothetical protein H1S01_03180 [Heliobacterium chlorum]|uniref:Uncharacterized protein n=1 Tax=Heliobacterium chlorum TaxID=2698 RepID=A0ABR7SYB4_HELCL|nr:hypothetical protein [Heliobacterium chlorum]MBC9783514.1 hypothetical protein [Heliobacterium chlorum]
MTETEKEIRERWFRDHQATLTEHGDLKVLEWRRLGTSSYYVRYVFDRNMMYVSGDLGSAVFWFTEHADVHTQATYSLSYFEGKMVAFSDDRRDFNENKAVKRLREWLNDIKQAGKEYDHDDMQQLFEDARRCSHRSHWDALAWNHSILSELDDCYHEWFFRAGDEMPWRIIAYLIGLKMASEQLKVKQAE